MSSFCPTIIKTNSTRKNNSGNPNNYPNTVQQSLCGSDAYQSVTQKTWVVL